MVSQSSFNLFSFQIRDAKDLWKIFTGHFVFLLLKTVRRGKRKDGRERERELDWYVKKIRLF